MEKRMISILFWIAGIYEGILGVAFLFFGMNIFDFYQITPPNHIGYIQFPAAILIVFSIMFFEVARNPIKNQSLIFYGILLKISYCSVVFYHWIAAGLPWIWKPFAICDLVFGILFAFSLLKIRKIK